MNRDLRKLPFRGALSRGLCSLVWQGDFGKGVSTGSGVSFEPGVNPCLLEGPLAAAGVADDGAPAPGGRLGAVARGDAGAEFVCCKLTLAAAADLLPGQWYFWDENYSLTLGSAVNASNLVNAEAGVLNVWAPQAPAGTYHAWVQRAGHCSVKADAGSVAGGFAETSSLLAGNMKFPAAPSAGQKSISPASAFVASSAIAFTGATVAGSPCITGVVSASAGGGVADLQLGQAITGAGLPANAIIAAIDRQGSGWRVTLGTNTAGSLSVAQNATATAAGVVFTVTSHVTANLSWPTLARQN